jgi:hypothetical protein
MVSNNRGADCLEMNPSLGRLWIVDRRDVHIKRESHVDTGILILYIVDMALTTENARARAPLYP